MTQENSPLRLVLFASLIVVPGWAQTVNFSEYPIPTLQSFPQSIALGPDAALWFTEEIGNNIGRVTTSGAITEFPLPNPESIPVGIVAGPDGALWFTEESGNRIGRITTAGVITEFPIPTEGGSPVGITVGSDGALWFTENYGNNIGRITTSGVITEFPIPTVASAPDAIAPGPDGALWFTEYSGNNIGQITTAGLITEFAIPTQASNPIDITPGPDGDLWFTENYGNNIGRITTSGVITEFPIPTVASAPDGIAQGPDGALWFTENSGNNIGRITTAGAITEFSIPTQASNPIGIVLGPDSALWFIESTANQIGRLALPPVITCSSEGQPQVGMAYTVNCNGTLGTPPYAYSISSGTLPPGLNLNSSTGSIIGTPAAAGPFSFIVTVTDGASQTAFQPERLVVNPPPLTIVTATLPNGTGNVAGPAFSILGIPATQNPETTITNASVTLSQAVATTISGTLTLSFVPHAADVPNGYIDPNLQFENTPSKTIYNFTISAGQTSVPIPPINPGTVAGDIIVTLTVGGSKVASSTVTAEPIAPVITSVQIIKVPGGFDIEVVANSTPRDVSNAVFAFTPVAGVRISGNNTLTASISSLMSQWYSSSEGQANGSLFKLTVPFTLGGDLSDIQSVTVTLSNSVGISAPVTATQ